MKKLEKYKIAPQAKFSSCPPLPGWWHKNHSPPDQVYLKTTVEKSKLNYYPRLSDKLLDSKTSPKSYWPILKTFLNNKKISSTPPLLHNGKFIMDLKEKAELFNDFFSKEWAPVNNNNKLSSVLTKKTCKSLWSVEISTYDILQIIRNLNTKQSSRSWCDKYSNVQNLWWIYLQTTRHNFSVTFRKWEIPLRMEKSHCSSCLKKKTISKS